MVDTQNSTSNGSRDLPGAMTMAMRAVDLPQLGPRALRVGILQGERIVEEKVFPPRQSVVVGSSETSDLVVTAKAFPPGFELFQAVGDGYVLNFTDNMEGRVALPSGVRSLNELRSTGAARNAGGHWQVKLSDSCRGKVTLGDVCLLFQFVVVPPVQPRPQLPVAVKGAFFRNIDWTFTAFVVFAYMIFLGAVIFLESYDYPVPDTDIEPPPSVARLIFQEPPPPVEEEEEQAPDEEGEQEAAESAEEAPAEEQETQIDAAQDVDAKAAESDEVRERIADEVASKAEAMLLGALGDGGALANVLAGGAVTSNAGDVLAQASAVGVAKGGSAAALRTRAGGGGSGQGGDLGSLKAKGGKGATSAKREGNAVKERVVRGKAKLGGGGDIGGSGEFDSAVVVKTIKSRIRAIQRCYETELKNDTSLAGKVTIKFTIQQSGTVSNVSSTANTSGSSGLAACIVKTMKRLRFRPGPEGGSVTFSYPFVFAPQR